MVRRPDAPSGPSPDGVPELDLDLRPTRPMAPQSAARSAPEEEAALELAVDPRSLVLERDDTVTRSMQAVSAAVPASRASGAHASPMSAPLVPLPPGAPLAAGADVASDALLLADYGEPPRHWALSPLYAYRVYKRRRELKAALGGRREEAKRTSEEAENALVAFAEILRPAAEKTPAYATALDELRRAEEMLRSRDQVASSEQSAQNARLAQADTRLAALEAELAQAQREERAAAGQVTDAQEQLSREEAKLKRAEIELRAAQQRGGGGG